MPSGIERFREVVSARRGQFSGSQPWVQSPSKQLAAGQTNTQINAEPNPSLETSFKRTGILSVRASTGYQVKHQKTAATVDRHIY